MADEIGHRKRRADLIAEVSSWMAANRIEPDHRVEYLANFIERGCAKWAADLNREGKQVEGRSRLLAARSRR
jgi:hypothetical protein